MVLTVITESHELSLPLYLKLNRPATSAPLITSIADICGVVIYFPCNMVLSYRICDLKL